jgi:hypothetical protein
VVKYLTEHPSLTDEDRKEMIMAGHEVSVTVDVCVMVVFFEEDGGGISACFVFEKR